MSKDKPIVCMYYTFPDKIGGPLTYINTIKESKLQYKYNFKMVFQNKAPGGVDIGLLRKMIFEIKQINPNIVHVQGAQSEGFYGVVAAKLAGCKNVILTIHGFAHDDSKCKGIKNFLYKYIIEPLTIRMADKVFCVCEFASNRKIVVNNARKRNRGYIHNPVPQLVPSKTRKQIRDDLGICEDDIVFAISGRVTRDKGFDILVNVIKLLNERHVCGFRILVIGDGDYLPVFRDILREQCEDNQVITVGQTTCVADYLLASDAFIFPSRHENLSISLLEACSFGLPCIVSNVGGNSEIVSNGYSGYVIDGFDVNEYVEKMEQLLNDHAILKKMQNNARRDITERFSVDNLCTKLEVIYDE